MEDLKGKRLLLLGGSLWKNIIKDFANKHGIVLIATGNNQDAGIFDIAEESYKVDSTDAEKMKKFIISKNIDGVYLGGSEAVISSALSYLADLNLATYCTKNQWDILQNKVDFKNHCLKHDLPVAKQYNVKFEDILKKSDKVNFPVITKPQDGSGSSGFSVCQNFDQLKEGYLKAKQFSPSGSVLVEKFVKNESIIVFYTFSCGEVYFSGIEDKYTVKYREQGSYVAGLHLFESNKKDRFRKRFESKIKNFFNSLEIKEGSIWMEIFNDGDNYYFNEAGYRYSGSVSVYPVDYFYNINQVASDIYYALTGKSNINGFDSVIKERVSNKNKYGIYSIHLNPGEIKKIEGIKDILQINNIVVMPTTMDIGHVVQSTGTVSQVFAFVHFVFNSVEECKEVIEKVHEKLKVIDENGHNMCAKLFDTSEIKVLK